MTRVFFLAAAVLSLISQSFADSPPPPLLQIVAQKGDELTLGADNIVEVKTEPDSRSGGAWVQISMDEAFAAAFYKMSVENLGQQVVILICGEEVSRPVLLDPITGGKSAVGPFAAKQASETVELLSGARACSPQAG